MSENFTIQQLNFKLRKALNEQKITELTEIQSLCIPQIIEGHNVSGGAKTGTGKTLAYLIPVYEYLLKLSPEETHLFWGIKVNRLHGKVTKCCTFCIG